MKKDIHPKVNKECKVKCACGNTFVTMSTLDSITVEICSKCHPFYTGQRRFVDTEGRIDVFKKRMALSDDKKAKAGKKNKKKTPTTANAPEKSLKEMLSEVRKEMKPAKNASTSSAPEEKTEEVKSEDASTSSASK